MSLVLVTNGGYEGNTAQMAKGINGDHLKTLDFNRCVYMYACGQATSISYLDMSFLQLQNHDIFEQSVILVLVNITNSHLYLSGRSTDLYPHCQLILLLANLQSITSPISQVIAN